MKKIAFILCFIATTVNAEVVVNGGFGTDGATGESIPTENSSNNAAEIYKALKVKLDSNKDKTIMIEDESRFSCKKPIIGISRLEAGCDFIMRASQNGKVKRGQGLSGTLKFTGKLASEIFKALPKDTSGRVGAEERQVANLSCTKVVRPGSEATCTIENTNVISMDIEI